MRVDQVNGTDTQTCVPCPEGFSCDEIGIEVETVTILSGFWRQTNRSESGNVETCFNQNACIGGNVTTTEGTKCSAGHRGPFCGVCDANWYGGTDSKPCKLCEGDLLLSFLPMIALLLLICVVVIVFIRGGKSATGIAAGLTKAVTSGNIDSAAENVVKAEVESRATKYVDDKVDSMVELAEEDVATAGRGAGYKSRVIALGSRLATLFGKLQVKFKIIISLVQVINGLGFVFSIPYPPLYDTMMNEIGGVRENVSNLPRASIAMSEAACSFASVCLSRSSFKSSCRNSCLSTASSQ